MVTTSSLVVQQLLLPLCTFIVPHANVQTLINASHTSLQLIYVVLFYLSSTTFCPAIHPTIHFNIIHTSGQEITVKLEISSQINFVQLVMGFLPDMQDHLLSACALSKVHVVVTRNKMETWQPWLHI